MGPVDKDQDATELPAEQEELLDPPDKSWVKTVGVRGRGKRPPARGPVVAEDRREASS